MRPIALRSVPSVGSPTRFAPSSTAQVSLNSSGLRRLGRRRMVCPQQSADESTLLLTSPPPCAIVGPKERLQKCQQLDVGVIFFWGGLLGISMKNAGSWLIRGIVFFVDGLPLPTQTTPPLSHYSMPSSSQWSCAECPPALVPITISNT
jgi:hypothetical protein